MSSDSAEFNCELEPLLEMGRLALKSRNVKVLEYRTSVRLEAEMWNALKEVAKLESCKVHNICSLVSMHKDPNASLTAAIRVFLMMYFRAAATEEGHSNAGHGNLRLKLQQRLRETQEDHRGCSLLQ